jgi:O-acetyl-ADP-ribose deacetylase (regulator of RNase III)
MTNLIHRNGDIFTTHARAIGHGVNTHGMMGAGIAVQFSKRFPDMEEEYRKACKDGSLKGGGVMPWSIKPAFGPDLMIFNIASQEKPGANASYDFLVSGVKLATDICELAGQPVLALPRIGSGIGGLDEPVVESILEALARRTKVDIELWTYKP